MDRLLIVDDEALTREGLKETIDWASKDIVVCGVAENGLEGLELARALKPDLVLADVRMPIMDGLEMAQKLHEENADLSVVILSGYADFENARRALNFGVSGFLLKPIDNDELLKKCVETLTKLHKKRAESRQLGQMSDSLPIIRRHLAERYFQDEETADRLEEYNVYLPEEGTLVYVKTTSDYQPLLQQCQLALDVCLAEELEDCAVLVCRQPVEEVVRAVEKILDEMSQLTVRYNVSAVPFVKADAGQAFNRAVELCKNAKFFTLNSVMTQDYGNFKKLVRDALAIIERDFDKKISVKSVAYDLYTSESHLMHEFKNQTGKTFNECLTEFRMFKAKELLLSGQLRIGEIGYAVGYTDVKYFGQVFKEYFGSTPSDFLDKYRK